MVETLGNWVVRRYIGTYLTGWHTKLGALITTGLGVNALILVLVQAALLVQDRKYVEAAYFVNGPEMWAALGFFGITKLTLGVANKIEKQETGELARDVAKIEATLPAPERANAKPMEEIRP